MRRYRITMGSEIIYPESRKDRGIYVLAQDGSLYRLDKSHVPGMFQVMVLPKETYLIEYSTGRTDFNGAEIYEGDTLTDADGCQYHVIDCTSFAADLERDPDFINLLYVFGKGES